MSIVPSLMQLFYLEVTGPVYTLDEGSTDISFQSPDVPMSLDKAILTFKYSMPGTGARTLKVFAQCTDPTVSSLIDLGSTISNDSPSVSAYVSQCLEIKLNVQQVVFACNEFRIVFEGTTAPSVAAQIHVKDVEFSSDSVVGNPNVCRKCSKFCCQPLCTDLRFQLQRPYTIDDFVVLNVQSSLSDNHCIDWLAS